jgi:N,N'-diacetyllegionaminate synthase
MTHRTEIVAELAQGFEGRPEVARLLLLAAARAGASAAKFQLVYADELATADYVHHGLFRSLEMTDDVWESLVNLGSKEGIGVWFDIFGERSLALSERLGAGAVKLHGSDTANEGLLAAVARSGVPRVILGAGGGHLDEIETALQVLCCKRVVVMLGFQGYPTADSDNQILRVRALADRFAGDPRVSVGFADHAATVTPGTLLPAALAMGAGALMVEKHLSLGRVLRLEDHESALGPDEFEQFCVAVRACDALLGGCASRNDFGMSESERAYRLKIRRHVVAARDLTAGQSVTPDDVILRRSSSEHALRDLASVYGRRVCRAVMRLQPLTDADLEQLP